MSLALAAEDSACTTTAAGEAHAIAAAKFFPKLAAACHAHALFDLWFGDTKRANPGRRLRKPSLADRRSARVALDAILVEPRTARRKKRRSCAARKRWKSLAYVRGGKKDFKLS